MEYLLRTLDPDRHPVVVMGDRADLKVLALLTEASLRRRRQLAVEHRP